MEALLNDPLIINTISWLGFGLLVGLMAGLIDPGKVRGGILGTIALGILGSLLGVFLGSWALNMDVGRFSIEGFLLAVGGALLLILLQRLLLRKDEHIKTPTGRFE